MIKLDIKNYINNEHYYLKGLTVIKKHILITDKKNNIVGYRTFKSKQYKQIIKALFYRVINHKNWYNFLIMSLDYKEGFY